jgi:hypothetical protein
VVEIRWTTAFLDTPRRAPGADDVVPFWQQLTATRLSARRGEHQEFMTLMPADGDPFLRAQDSDGDTPGCHLDLHVHDVRAATDQAVESGAELVADRGTLVLLRSPAGFSFCLVTHRQGVQRPKPVRFPTAGARAGSFGSLVDQLCIDVPAALFDSEVAWWSGLTGWLQRPGRRARVRISGASPRAAAATVVPAPAAASRRAASDGAPGLRQHRPRCRSRPPREHGRRPAAPHRPLGHLARPRRPSLLHHRPGPGHRPAPAGQRRAITKITRPGPGAPPWGLLVPQ